MTFLSRLFRGFSSKPRARSVADRLGGYEPPAEARPWTPSEPPPELPWERDENGPLTADEPSTHVEQAAVEGTAQRDSEPHARPVSLDDFRSDDELPTDYISRRFG